MENQRLEHYRDAPDSPLYFSYCVLAFSPAVVARQVTSTRQVPPSFDIRERLTLALLGVQFTILGKDSYLGWIGG